MDYNTKIDYIQEVLMPELVEAFKRGDEKYFGDQHFDSPIHMDRTLEEDIRHVTRCHVGVRLAEAEDASSYGNNEGAMKKIESAIGYLVILHMRQHDKE